MELRAARPHRVYVHRAKTNFGITVLVWFEFLIKRRVRLVDFQVAIAIESQEDFQCNQTQQESGEGESKV